jgi:hypothetical protein
MNMKNILVTATIAMIQSCNGMCFDKCEADWSPHCAPPKASSSLSFVTSCWAASADELKKEEADQADAMEKFENEIGNDTPDYKKLSKKPLDVKDPKNSLKRFSELLEKMCSMEAAEKGKENGVDWRYIGAIRMKKRDIKSKAVELYRKNRKKFDKVGISRDDFCEELGIWYEIIY